jgi:hypothetical protein
MKLKCQLHGQNIRFHIGCVYEYIVTYIFAHSRLIYTRTFKISLHNDDDDDNNNNISCPSFTNFN